MDFCETQMAGAFVIEPEKIEDERGFFARVWCRKEVEAYGLNHNLVQSNLSYNRKTGTLRGMHYQIAPYEEAKLVRCVRGVIFDVIVDLRHDSPTYLRWMGIELSAANRKMLYVPERVAHGFQTLEDHSEVFYQVSQFHTPSAERGVRWNDPAFGIEWPPVESRVISAKDQKWPLHSPMVEAGSKARSG